MKIQVYNPNTLALEQDNATGIDFGTIFQGNHCENPVIVKPVATTESSFTQMKLFLQSAGGFTQSEFGRYKNSNLLSGITAGSAYLSDNFDVEASPALTGDGFELTASNPEYVWLDVETGPTEKSSTTSINYQFVFEYN